MGKVKQWKTNGEEDKFIEKLIKQGKITKFTKPCALKKNYPAMFSTFSSNVMRNHLNTLKRNNGIYLDTLSEDEEDDESGEGNSLLADELRHTEPTKSLNVSLSHKNYPFLCEVYKNPDNELDKVILAISLPGGSQGATMELNDDGTIVVLKFKWPKILYNLEDLFTKPLAAKQITRYHPKVLRLKEGLSNVRARIDSVPESTMEVTLPIKVQTSVDSWTKTGVSREDGSQAIVAEFTGFVKEYNKKIADLSVKFD